MPGIPLPVPSRTYTRNSPSVVGSHSAVDWATPKASAEAGVGVTVGVGLGVTWTTRVGVGVGGWGVAVGVKVGVGVGVAMNGRMADEVFPRASAKRASARTSRTSWPSLM